MATPLYKIDPDRATLHISKGNSKIGRGIWSFSTLPGNAEHMMQLADGTLLTDIHGTCGKLCQGCFKDCYARKTGLLHFNACIQAWAENTVLLRSGRVWAQLEDVFSEKNAKAAQAIADGMPIAEAREKLAGIKCFRINVSGEVENAQQFDQWVDLAIRYPMTLFGLYTKNFDALGQYLDYLEREGLDLPENFAINISQWNHCADEFIAKYADRWQLNIFEYDPTRRPGHGFSQEDVERLRRTPHCPGIMQDGRHRTLPDGTPATCDKCKMSCYRKTGQRIAVYAH